MHVCNLHQRVLHSWSAAQAESYVQAELVLLDHGLYRTIDDRLRLEYAGLWQVSNALRLSLADLM